MRGWALCQLFIFTDATSALCNIYIIRRGAGPCPLSGLGHEGSYQAITQTSAHGKRSTDFQVVRMAARQTSIPAECVCALEAEARTQIMQSAMCQLVEVDSNREDVF